MATIKFRGTLIPGSPGPVVPGLPALQVSRQQHWGRDGESEIVGMRGGRDIACDHWLHSPAFTTFALLQKELARLDQLVGQHGTLEVAGTTARSYDNCTFGGCEWLPFAGQEVAGPIPDFAGTLGPVGSWLINVRLTWRQLKAVQ